MFEKAGSNEASIIAASSIDNELHEYLREQSLAMDREGFIRWCNDNPRHPRNWTYQAKAYNTIVILLLEFMTSAVGTAGTSAAQEMQDDFNIDLTLSLVCLTSTYLIGQGVGGIFFPPYSEVFGRKTLYILSTFVFAVFSVITASVHSLPAIIIGRLLSGLASATPTIVVAGSIEDLFNMQARVWMIFVWAVVGNAAVRVGPIYGSYLAHEYSFGRRWVFNIPAIGLGILLCFCFTLKKTRPSLLLRREAKILQKRLPTRQIQILNPDAAPGLRILVAVTLVRPIRLLFTEPIVMAVAFMGSVTCALFYLQAESIPLVFETYGWSPATALLGFVPVLLGCLASFVVRFLDQRKLHRVVQSKRRVEPEDKLTGFAIAAPFLSLGLWVFAWTVPPATRVHWVVPMLAQLFVGFALNENVYTLTGHLADSYTIYAASGFAGLILARASTCAVIVPFTQPMYVNLGYNTATSILAAIATGFCIAPLFFIEYGRRIRGASQFAKLSLATYDANKVEDDMNSN
ncbi:putative MFS multidrug transporter [Polychaeton citri CBS 116435]|uniref:MFS multidrug transporter n=1 Tax=Polychaeton citri CBS 116435 TaxID=1314669 RepID=A0A9P4ULT6_9PEZI|nr:putative MFS multidrug transporter [Polychaeton citri CBS 116435]